MICYNHNGDSMNFKYEKITINKITFDIIIDEEGIKWYPFTKILKRVLKKDEDAQKYRDTSFGKDLRLWPLKNPTPYVSEVWYIKESALIRYLKNVKVNPYTKKTIKREMALHGALEYFGINRQERDNTYTIVRPTKKEYSEWELACFKFDPEISAGLIWKRCDTCERYFPYSKNYFQIIPKSQEMTTCLECKGQIFKNNNPDAQKMKELKREDLIKYLIKDDVIGLYERLEKRPFPEELRFFQSKSRILKVLEYLEERRIKTGEGNFYLSKIAATLHMHTTRLKYIVNNDFEIGTVKPLSRHSSRTIYENLSDNDKQIRDLMNQAREERRKAKKIRDSEYWKKKLRDENENKRKESEKGIIDLCDNNVKKYKVPKRITEWLFPQEEVVYAFATKRNIHFIVHNQPIEKKKIIIHRTPSRNTRFLKLEKELKEAFKENES